MKVLLGDHKMEKIFALGIIALCVGLMITPSLSAEISKETSIQKKTENSITNTVNGYAVELSCDDSYHSVKEGETTTFTVTITNTGTLDDSYDISVAPLEIAGITIYVNGQYGGLHDFSLKSNTSKTIEVNVSITSNIPSNGERPVAIAARSQNDTTVFDELHLTVNIVGPLLRVTFENGLGIRILIKNEGNIQATNIYPTTISISGVVLFGGNGDPPIEKLDPNSSALWKQPILAIGPGHIEVTVSCDQGATATAATTTLFLGPLVTIRESAP